MSATFLKAPPIKSSGMNTPDNHPATFVSAAPQMPPTAFSFIKLPNNKPSPTNKSELSAVTRIAGRRLTVSSSPAKQEANNVIAACLAGLELTVNLLPAILVTALSSLLFVGFGLLFGSLMNEKAVGD